MLTENQWSSLRAEYVTGDISYRKLAEKYHLSYKTISNRGTAEGWKSERGKYRENVRANTLDLSAGMKAADRALKLVALQQSADKMAEVIQGVFNDADQFHRYIVSEGLGAGQTQTEERQYEKVDTKAIRDLTAAMKDLSTVMRNVYDIPTQAELEARKIASERLNMDKHRAELDETKNDTVVVKFQSGEDLSE